MTFPKPGQKSHRLQVRHAAEKERVFFHFFGSETTFLEFNQDECTVQTYNPLVSQKHVLLYSSWCARRGHLRSEETHKILSETKLHTRMPRTYTTTQPKGREGDHEFCDPFKVCTVCSERRYWNSWFIRTSHFHTTWHWQIVWSIIVTLFANAFEAVATYVSCRLSAALTRTWKVTDATNCRPRFCDQKRHTRAEMTFCSEKRHT